MKDVKVLTDGALKPTPPGEEGSPQLLVVRNNDVSGRRLGIYAQRGTAVAGQRLNHADVLHEVKPIVPTPSGFNSAVELNLSAKRNYYKFAECQFNEFTSQSFPNLSWFAENVETAGAELKFPGVSTDLSKLRLTLKSGDLTPSGNNGHRTKNTSISFSFVFAGTPYHVGLEINKHPAHITADLNMRLNRIHPQLRGYVASNDVGLEFFIAPPEGLDIIIPTTSFPSIEDYSLGFPEEGVQGHVALTNLNSKLPSALLIDNVNGVRTTVNNLASVNGQPAKKTTDQFFESAFVVDLNAFTHEVETPTLYKGRVTIPSTAFATWADDERLCFAMLKLRRLYEDGRVFRLLNVRYRTSEGGDLAFIDQNADLLVSLSRDPNVEPQSTLGTGTGVYLDELQSQDNDHFQSYFYPDSSEIRFAESGGLNEESAMYVGVFATPNLDTRNSIFFRQSVGATYLEIEYELVEADVIPRVKMDDLGTLDYHYIKTEQHAFIPVAFDTSPLHNWNLEFITEGQAERYQGINHGPANEGDTDIHMTTDGTVGEMVILSNIDYTKVKAPTTGEPNYHYTGQIGAQGWLYQNLPWVNVVTTRAVDVVKSDYKVVFPSVEMTGELTPLSEPLVSKQSDGTIVITGRFSNPAYEKNVFLHSLLTKTEFSIKGAVITPVEPVTFDANTGNFSARMAINDLVEPGPGTHVFRVTTTAKFPWLTSSSTYTQTMNIEILAAVEGIEDDVTFIANTEFGTELTEASGVGYRLIDMDTGEILATGPNALALKEDAQTRGLVDVDLIFGTGPKAPIGNCTPSVTYVKFTDSSLEPGQVLRLAYEVTDVDGQKSVASDTFIVDTTNPIGYSTNERGPEPLQLLTKQGPDVWSGEAFYGRTVKSPGYSDNWKDTCHLGETWITGELMAFDITTFTSSEPLTAHLKVTIDGVEHDLTNELNFYSEEAGDQSKIDNFYNSFVTKLEQLGFSVDLYPNNQFFNGASGPYNAYNIRISYEIGQFNNVVIAAQQIINDAYTARWRSVSFNEECKQRKTGYTHPDEYVVRINGWDEKTSDGDFRPGLFDVKFDTCENLGVALAEGELDYYERLAFSSQEEGPFVGQELPTVLHSCGQVIYY